MAEKGTTRRRVLQFGAFGAPLALSLSTQAHGAVGAGLGAGEAEADPQGMGSGAGTGTPGTGQDRSGLSVETVQEAEKLFGVTYTEEERLQILDGYEARLETLARLRALDPPNDLAPAQVFDPRLPDRPVPPQEDRVVTSSARPPQPSTPDDLAFAPLTALSAWIRDGYLSSRMLTDIYLERIGTHGDRLECMVTVTADLARQQADEADAERAKGIDRGPLHGVPYVLKDICDTAGIPTTWGARPYGERVPERDAAVTARLRDAGAVLLGKSASGAIASGDLWFGGRTRNPWNLSEGSSGSSAGSAAATAAGLAGFGIGSETLGSIISPSHRCGTAGLRPTFGRVSRAGTMALCWSLDKIGPLCRRVEDTALVLAAINGQDIADPGSIAMGFDYDGRRSLEGMRIGYDPAWFEGASPAVAGALDAARMLAGVHGAEVVEFRLPDLPYGSLYHVVEAEAAAAFESLTLTDRDDELVWQDARAWPNTWRRARFLSAVDLVQMDRFRRRVMGLMADLFSQVDLVIGPVYAASMLIITNFTGHPSLALRAGFTDSPARTIYGMADAETGKIRRVPEAVSLWAPLFGEGPMIRFGVALEAALGVAPERPAGF